MLQYSSHKALTAIPCRPTVSGQYLAKNHLPVRGRGRLAAEILCGKIEIGDLTVKQVARLCRVSVPTVNAARQSSSDKLVVAWNAASDSDRIVFAKRVGVASLWDGAISPAID